MENNTQSRPAKTWILVINNYTEADIEMLKAWVVNRILVSKEVGENGTPHLQGAITFTRAYRLSALKKLHSQAHWEVAKAADCFNYCAKEGSEIIINVNNSTQGTRTDIASAIDLIKESGIKRVREEAAETYIKYHKGLEKLNYHYAKQQRTEKPFITWIYGPTGVGKTHWVIRLEPEIWISSDSLQWFDGYEGNEAVLFDDFRGDMCKFRFLLRLLDRYPLQVPIKGGFTWWTPKRIYITSCKHPKDVYNKENFDNEEKVDQLLRRIDEIKFFEEKEMVFPSLQEVLELFPIAPVESHEEPGNKEDWNVFNMVWEGMENDQEEVYYKLPTLELD